MRRLRSLPPFPLPGGRAALATARILPLILLAASPTRAAEAHHDALARELAALRRQVADLELRLESRSPDPSTSSSSTGVPSPEPTGREDDDLAALRALAEKAAGGPVPEPERPEEIEFEARGLGLQKLNPELSVVGDLLYSWGDQPIVGGGKSDFQARTFGIHLESYLDPYTRFKAAVPVNPNGAGLGEGYLTRYGVARGLNLTLGKFRQQFGVVNRWHLHGLDQTNFPLALRQVFGNGGLNQTGLSLDWTPVSEGRVSHELTLQVTDGDNPRVFGENDAHRPAVLARYRNYRDLDESTYLEFGLTGLFGENDRWSVGGADLFRELDTRVYGLDLNLLWEPTDRMRYRNLEWRSELYRIEKDILAPDGSGEDQLEAWGFYSYLQQKVNRTTTLGLRYDRFRPDTKGWAGQPFAPLAVQASDADQWALIPYVTYQQSPFVKYRLELQHTEGRGVGRDEDRAVVQVIFAAGPHKHDRY